MEQDKIIKEGWVEFRRISCKEGFIDRWVGDIAHNPNNEKKGPWSLNTFVSYFRLNEQGDWKHYREFDNDFLSAIFILGPDFVSNEIWEGYRSNLVNS